MRRIPATAVASVVLLAAGSLSGCRALPPKAFATRSPPRILAAAERAFQGLDSVRFVGVFKVGGSVGRLSVDLDRDRGCRARVVLFGGGSYDLIVVEGRAYFLPDHLYLGRILAERAPEVMKRLGLNWARIPTRSAFADPCRSVDDIGEDIFSEDAGHPERGRRDVVDREPAIELILRGKREEHVWIGLAAPHHVLRMCEGPGPRRDCVTFSRFDESFDIEAPDDDDVVDLRRDLIELQPGTSA